VEAVEQARVEESRVEQRGCSYLDGLVGQSDRSTSAQCHVASPALANLKGCTGLLGATE